MITVSKDQSSKLSLLQAIQESVLKISERNSEIFSELLKK